MQYMLLIYGDEASWDGATEEQRQAMLAEYGALTQDLRDKGQYVGGDELASTSTATTVRVRDGDALVTDGPFAETKEQLGGYYVLNVANVDEAIEAGNRCPGAMYGTIELRPIQEFPDQPQG
jgi:hypothetical protein